MANKHSGFLALGDLVPNTDATYVLGADALNWVLTNFNNIIITNNSGGTGLGKFHLIDRYANVKLLTVTNAGNVGIATTTPTARLHLPAGTTAANSAPLKFTSGTNTTIAEPGAVEYDGLLLYLTITGPTRKTIAFTSDIPTTASGVYTPTRSAESNLDSNVTMSEAQYMRIGSTVTVSGRFTADPTAGGAANFEITLPVASNIGAAEDVAGVAFCSSIAGQGAAIYGVAANDTAKIDWIAVDTTSQVWSYVFSYQII